MNSQFLISSIIKSIIISIIIVSGIYAISIYKPDFYNKYLYSTITGERVKSNTGKTKADKLGVANSDNTYQQTTGDENNSYSVQEGQSNVVPMQQSNNSSAEVVSTPVNMGQSSSQELAKPNTPHSNQSSPKFIDGYEVITIADTEPYELSENSSIGNSNQTIEHKPVQPAQVQPEVTYVEQEIPADYSGPNWAVVAINTEVFNKEQKAVGSILGGIIVETHEKIPVKNAVLVKCFQIKNGVVNRDVEFYVKECDLVMFRGPYKNQVHPDKTTIIEFCTIRGKYQTELDNLREEAIKSNPHYQEYQAAVAAYKKLQKEAEELEAKRKTTSGAEKANLEDRIHKLKLEEVTARRTLTEVQRKYEAWRHKHLGTGDDIKITPTPELNRLKQQMDALYPRANAICPGI